MNLYSLLNHFQIAYAENVKNVGRGWIGLAPCPRCGDTKYHIAVSKKTRKCSCLKCTWKGSIVDYLKEVTQLPIKDILKVYKQYKGDSDAYLYQFDSNTGATRTTLPYGLLDELPIPHIQYLTSRGFDHELLQVRYDIKAVWYLGKPEYRYRIIAPIYYDDVLVSWLGRAIYKEIDPRYMNCPAEQSIIPTKQCLYGMEYVTDTAVMVEGITDVWKFGLSAVAALGASFTTRQMYELHKRGVKNICWLYDPDETGRVKAEEASKAAALLGMNVWRYDLGGDRDIGDLESFEVDQIRLDILGKMS